MAKYERIKRKEPEEQEESLRKKRVSQPLYDQRKASAEGTTDSAVTQSMDNHATLLAKATSDEQRANLVTGLQQTYGNAYVQQLMERIQTQRGSGQSLEPETQAEMEVAFERDFSEVRIHTDATAAKLTKELEAEAFATGKDVFFQQGAYQPSSEAGKKLLAHELTHVVQQPGTTTLPMRITQPSEAAETEAEMAGHSVLTNEVRTSNTLESSVIARQGATVVEPALEEIEMTKGREPGVFGNAPVGHASDWAFMLTPDLVLWQQGQYEDRSDIPYDAVRCGASAILGAAIVGGVAGLSTFIDRLKTVVDSPNARESKLLPLADQRRLMSDLYSKWHFDPGAGWNEAVTNIVDPNPFTFDDLSWLQAIAYVQYVGQPGGGMSAAEVQAGVTGLAQAPSVPVSPAAYHFPTSAASLGGTISHNAQEVYKRFIAPNAPARLQPGESVILNMMMFNQEDHTWVIQRHAVTLSNIGGTFSVYNPETTPIAGFVLPYLPSKYRGLPIHNLMGRHLAESEANATEGIFGLTIGLVVEEVTSPFKF